MQGLSLKALIRTLSDAAFCADKQLCRDWSDAVLEMKSKGEFCMPPEPLRVSGMRVSFAAQVAESERLEFQDGSGDLHLDFNHPNGNFKGEIIFSPYDPEASFGMEETFSQSTEDDIVSEDTHKDMPESEPENTYAIAGEEENSLRDI